MKKLLILLTFVLFISCDNSHPFAPAPTKQVEHVYSVSTINGVDTIYAYSYQFGNYVGLGKAFIFYDSSLNQVATVKLPKDRNIVVRLIK